MAIEPSKQTIDVVKPLMSPEQAKVQWSVFENLKRQLLVEDDYQVIGGKRFIKRSGFRKVAVFFGISDQILKEERVERQDESFVWRIVVQATAPNGRASVGVGACDSKERKFAHTEHDVYSTAHTRAKSRAISDMIAGGIVSAEEMSAEEAEASIPSAPTIDKTVPASKEDSPEKPLKEPRPYEGEEGKPLEYYYPKIEALGWNAYKEKRPAEPDEGGWLFSDTPGAEDFVDRIQREGEITVKMGDHRFLCRISGDEGQFINRTPLKEDEHK